MQRIQVFSLAKVTVKVTVRHNESNKIQLPKILGSICITSNQMGLVLPHYLFCFKQQDRPSLNSPPSK